MTQVAGLELARFPRADRGSPQNQFRMAYWLARLNGLGRRPQIPRSAGAAYTLAVASVRRTSPEFEPIVAGHATSLR